MLAAATAAFGMLMTALGFGAAIGVVTLLWLQGRLPRDTVFTLRGDRHRRVPRLAASFSALAPAALMVGGVGACAGTTYVTGFTVLQENVSDEMRGRTFATLYTVVRLCLLISLTISPLWADFWDWVTEKLLTDQAVSIGPYTYSFAGVRIALWGGGLITVVAGVVAWRSIRRAEREAVETGEPVVPEHGPIEPFRPLGLVEPSPVAEPIDDGTDRRRGDLRRRRVADAVGTTGPSHRGRADRGRPTARHRKPVPHRDARPVRGVRGRRRQRQEHAGGAARRLAA